MNEVVLKWHTPNDEGISFVQTLLEHYLKTRFTQLKSWTENSISLTKEKLRRILHNKPLHNLCLICVTPLETSQWQQVI
jgi:hypothetical protein